MAPRPSRREAICHAAVVLASRGGSHALTHQAIDVELGISRGSTSYYYRTRRALIAAVAHHLTARSRAEFQEAFTQEVDPPDPSSAAALIDAYVDDLAGRRRDDCRARLALLLDADCDGELRTALADCLFSRAAADELYRKLGDPDPDSRATELLDRLEGEVVRRTLLG